MNRIKKQKNKRTNKTKQEKKQNKTKNCNVQSRSNNNVLFEDTRKQCNIL